MNIEDFKQAAASFVGRDPDYFTTNSDGSPGPDKLLIAINNAKIFLQRQIDFEYARDFVDLTYFTKGGTGEGADLQRATRHGEACSINVKKVINLYTPHGFARLLPLRQKTFRGVADLVRGAFERDGHRWFPECRGGYDGLSPVGVDRFWTAIWGHTHRDPIYYQHGRRVYLYPKPFEWRFDETCSQPPPPPPEQITQLPLVADVIAFLPAYRIAQDPNTHLTGVDGKRVEPHLSDFILDDCYDYMLWRTIVELNVFLKDDDQVQVSQSKMTEALENIRAWNADLINAGYDIE